MINKEDSKYDFWFEKTDFLTNDQQQKLYKYYELIYEYNKVMNLTGIDDEFNVYLKHFYDSLTIIDQIEMKKGTTIADLGTGAGFPGIVLAICYTDIEIILIEPLTKRCKFLQVVVNELQLKNICIINDRAENIDTQFDYVVSRAVAKLNILLELSTPLVKTNGYFIALKGEKGLEEIKESKTALNKLDSKVVEIKELTLPFENSSRVNIKIQKIKETNKKYPRNFGQIKKNPL